MRNLILPLLLPLLGACAGTGPLPGSDASTNDGSSSNDSSTNDSSSNDGAAKDATADAIPYEAGSLDQCNPNDPNACVDGKKCCSEPTHQTPPSAYMCVTPTGGGGCPALP